MKLRHPRNPITDRRKNKATVAPLKVIDEYGPISAIQTDRILDWAQIGEKPTKGLKGGACNRQACQAEGAIFYNHPMKKYYCGRCMISISRDKFNYPEAMARDGHEMIQIDQDAWNDLKAEVDANPELMKVRSIRHSLEMGEYQIAQGNIAVINPNRY